LVERIVCAAAAAIATGFAVAATAGAWQAPQTLRSRQSAWLHVAATASRWRSLVVTANHEGRLEPSIGRRRAALVLCLSGLAGGFMLLGPAGAIIGSIAAPLAMRFVLSAQRERYAARVDGCAAEMALAIASALSAGHSVRGALLAAARATPEPLAGELDRVAVDLVLGRGVDDALAALRSRTNSPRVESLAGAIELHRNSGGDLVQLMRELATSFRGRDLARRDAHASTAQARFTAAIVAAIPLSLAGAAELAKPGTISGTFAFAPTALLMLTSLGLMAAGCAMCFRIGSRG
jgi:tight adherence protein B